MSKSLETWKTSLYILVVNWQGHNVVFLVKAMTNLFWLAGQQQAWLIFCLVVTVTRSASDELVLLSTCIWPCVWILLQLHRASSSISIIRVWGRPQETDRCCPLLVWTRLFSPPETSAVNINQHALLSSGRMTEEWATCCSHLIYVWVNRANIEVNM